MMAFDGDLSEVIVVVRAAPSLTRIDSNRLSRISAAIVVGPDLARQSVDRTALRKPKCCHIGPNVVAFPIINVVLRGTITRIALVRPRAVCISQTEVRGEHRCRGKAGQKLD